MPNITAFYHFLKQHPGYVGDFIRNISRVWWWRLNEQPIVVLTTESGGLGDYLWFRSYYSAIREHYAPRQCRIVVVGMRQWEPLALGLDESPTTNHFDIYRAFETPDQPLKIERLFFKLFRIDVYVDFRARHLKRLVKAKEYYFGQGFRDMKQYYESANNSVMNQWFALSDSFRHKPNIMPLANSHRADVLAEPFVIVVEGGNTQGKLSDKQVHTIVDNVLSRGYKIFFNGDYKKLLTNLTSEIRNQKSDIIDGYTYPLAEYPAVVSKCSFVVTVNTFVYHLAVQLEKPCVVLSANEYESVKLDQPRQIALFNRELQLAYESQTLQSYQSIPSVGLQDIECGRIVEAIDKIAAVC